MTQPDGLLYYPSRYDPPLGHAGFDVYLAPAPIGRYFDARRIVFPVEQNGMLGRYSVEHPYRMGNELRFTAGRIRLDAHDGDHEEIVTFGGQASIRLEGDLTVCRVTSSAPFFPLDDDVESPLVMLESELEIVMAQLRARWGKDESRHLDRLGEVEPMALFVASIWTLEERLGHLARVEDDPTTHQSLHLARDIRWLLERSGEWPAAAVGLDGIL